MHIHRKQLPEGTPIYLYNELPTETKIVARKNILQHDIEATAKRFKKELEEYKLLPIHIKVKSKFIKRYSREKKRYNDLYTKLNTDIDYCENFILQNLCSFTKDGTYIYYMLKP